MKANKWIDDAGIEAAEARVKALVDESIQFAEESPYPEPEELYKDVYAEPNYPFIIEYKLFEILWRKSLECPN